MASLSLALLLWAPLVPRIVLAQTILQNGIATEATYGNVVPPRAIAANWNDAARRWFGYETVQLDMRTMMNLTQLELSHVGFFDFADSAWVETVEGGDCKAFPWDDTWPSHSTWRTLDLLLGEGKLLMDVPPIGSVCYNDRWGPRDEDACADLVANMEESDHVLVGHPTAPHFPWLQDNACVPTTNETTAESRNCTLGGAPSTVVNATNVAEIQLGLNFARNHDLRLVVRNTGHDYAGKSSGAGALEIWTHSLKEMVYIPAGKFGSYEGPAARVGAAVTVEELYAFGDEQGVDLIGGICSTVGVAGGYSAGGGHSPLMGLYGVGADQVISVNLVLPNGQFIVASESSHPDIFWAVRGGGGGVWGIVTSIVVRAYPKLDTISSMQLTLSSTSAAEIGAENFWKGIEAFLSYFDKWPEKGVYTYWFLFADPTNPDVGSLEIHPMLAPGLSIEELTELVSPLLEDLENYGWAVEPQYKTYTRFLEAWKNEFPDENGVTSPRIASRLVPQSAFTDSDQRSTIISLIRDALATQNSIIAYNFASNSSGHLVSSARHPAWNNAASHLMVGFAVDSLSPTPDDEFAKSSLSLTNNVYAPWREFFDKTAEGDNNAAYMSEADILEPDWQRIFYGSNYETLKDIKEMNDPYELMWVITGVASEGWEIRGQIEGMPTQNGRLCRKSLDRR